MDQKTSSFINEKLFTEVKPVLFTDLIHHLKISPSMAKKLMFDYYKQTTNAKYNCVVMCCYKDQTIKIIHDIANIPPKDSIIDCFIYAFNPMNSFIPYYNIIDQKDCLTIKNSYELKVSETPKVVERTKTLEEKSKPLVRPTARSKTTPEEATGKKSKSKDMGLRSTALLAKMKKDRDDKEISRQNELRKRREENMQKVNKKNPEREAQMKELNNLFVEDDLDGVEKVGERSHPNSPEKDISDDKDRNNDILEDLLETTADDSLMDVPKVQQPTPSEIEDSKEPKSEEERSSFIDEDGYIVTKRPATSTPPRKPSPVVKRALSSSKQQETPSSNKRLKKQGTLESFFKRKAK